MTRWVEDNEPVSDLLEAWTNAFHDLQRASDACWRLRASTRPPIRFSSASCTSGTMSRPNRQQGPDGIHSLDPNLLQRGQTWRTKLEMLAVANSNRRKLWPGHPEGEARYLEWAKRPKPSVKLEKLTKTHQHHAVPTA